MITLVDRLQVPASRFKTLGEIHNVLPSRPSFFLNLVAASNAAAVQESIMQGETSANLATGALGNLVWAAQGADINSNHTTRMRMPVQTIITEFEITLSGAPGASTGYIFRLWDETRRSSKEVRIEGTDTTAKLQGPMIFDAGDYFIMSYEQIGTPTARTPTFKMTYRCANGEQLFVANLPTEGTFVDGVNKYQNPFGLDFLGGWQNDSDLTSWIMPVAGTFAKLRQTRGTNITSNSYDATLRNITTTNSMKVTVDNTGTQTFVDSGVDFYGWDSEETLTVSAGDRIEYYHAPTGVPNAELSIISYVFTPTTSGEYCVFGGTQDAMLANTTKEYMYLRGPNSDHTWNATEGNRTEVFGRAVTLSDFYVRFDDDPVQDVTFAFRNVTTGTERTITVTSANYTGASNTSDTLVVGETDEVVVSEVYTSSGTARRAFWSCKMTDTTALASQTPETKLIINMSSAGVSDTTANIKMIVLENRNDYQIVVSENSDLSSPTFTSSKLTVTSVDANRDENVYVIEAAVTGLTKETTYYYGLQSNGTINTDTGQVGQFITYPTGGAAPSATVTTKMAIYSCVDIDVNSGNHERRIDSLQSISEISNLGLVVDLGDRVYHDLTSTAEADYAEQAFRYLNHQTVGRMFSKAPIEYQQSDHDSAGGDDNRNDDSGPGSNKATEAMRQACYDAYDKLYNITNRAHPSGQGIVQSWARMVNIG
jgi:hypothetical protein